jgi:hypothetical protein
LSLAEQGPISNPAVASLPNLRYRATDPDINVLEIISHFAVLERLQPLNRESSSEALGAVNGTSLPASQDL